MKEMHYQIGIKELQIEACIGIYPEERKKKQPLLIDVEVKYQRVRKEDVISDTIDYDRIKEICILGALEEYYLLEKLGERIIDLLFLSLPILSAKVCLKKPEAMAQALYPYVIIESTTDKSLGQRLEA